MKLIIAGGRDFDDYTLLELEVTSFIEHGIRTGNWPKDEQ